MKSFESIIATLTRCLLCRSCPDSPRTSGGFIVEGTRKTCTFITWFIFLYYHLVRTSSRKFGGRTGTCEWL